MREWRKPELVVLVRHQPQEAVLQLCKFDDVQFQAPNDVFANCWQAPPTEQQQCLECSALLVT